MPRRIEDQRPVIRDLEGAQLDRVTGGAATQMQQADRGDGQLQQRRETVNRMMAEGPNERLGPYL